MLKFIFSTALALHVVKGDWLQNEKCKVLLNPASGMCCESEVAQTPSNKRELLHDCMMLHKSAPQAQPGEPPSCEVDKCFGEKAGYLNDDGSINMDALWRSIEQEFSHASPLSKKIHENCVENSKFEEYGMPAACDMIKFRHCVVHQVVSNCPKWKDTEECSVVKQTVDQCKTL